MKTVLLATDSDEVHQEVDAALASANVEVLRVRSGREVRDAVIELSPTVVILDLQIGSMGGVATCLDLRHEASAGRIEHQHVVLLLDRDVDAFIAEQADADGWLIKPLDANRLSWAVGGLLEQQLI